MVFRWGRVGLASVLVATALATLPSQTQAIAHTEPEQRSLHAQSVALDVPQRQAAPDSAAPGSPASGAITVRHTIARTSQFSAVGVSWLPGYFADNATVSIRTKKEDAAWSPWREETAESSVVDRQDVRDGIDVVWTGSATGVELVLHATSAGVHADGKNNPDVRMQLIDPGYLRSDAAAARVEPGTQRLVAPVTLQVHPRSEWGADPKYLNWTPEYAPRVDAVAIHHTATSNDYKPEDVPGILRAIYYYQAVTEKWGDIGYNVLVDKFGRAWEGRQGGVDKPVIGGHVLGFNTGTAGLTIIGNYVDTEPSAESLNTTAQYVAYKLGTAGLDPKSSVALAGGPNEKYKTKTTITTPRVFPHNFLGNTQCPGAHILSKLDAIREQASQLAGSVTLRVGS